MQALTANSIALLKAGATVDIAIHVDGLYGTLDLDRSDLQGGKFTIDRNSVSGSVIEIGNAETTELKFELDNDDRRFDSFVFQGATLTVTATIGIESLAMGKFIVDNQPKKLTTMEIVALDFMAKFNKPYSLSSLVYPATLGQILQDACTYCGVTLNTLTFTNSTHVVTSKPADEDLTFHEIVAWVAELAGANAWMDWNGQLRLSWYQDALDGASIPLTNLVTGGDFSNGTTGWWATAGSIAAAYNTLTSTAGNLNPYGEAITTIATPSPVGKKIYHRLKVKVTNSVCIAIHFYLYREDWAAAILVVSQFDPVANQEYVFSAISTLPVGWLGATHLHLSQQYNDATTANGKEMKVQYASGIDLTAMFGPGNEPSTPEEMDNYLESYSPGTQWFDGTKNVPVQLSELASFDSSDRYPGYEAEESNIQISGIVAHAGNIVYEPAGSTQGYALEISENSLLQSTDAYVTLVNALYAKLGGFTYRPTKVETKGYPHLWPGDMIWKMTDPSGVKFASAIMKHKYTLNGNSEIEAIGESAVYRGYASGSPFTAREKAVIKKVAYTETTTQVTALQQATLDLNETIMNSSGYYVTQVVDPGTGATISYMHDSPTLAGSDVIYTQTGLGFAWTDQGWNGGSPVWKYGYTASGNSVLKTLSVTGINADWINAGTVDANRVAIGAATQFEASSYLTWNAYLGKTWAEVIANAT